MWAVAGGDDFRDAVLRAANLGDDADTTAAIAGQRAGARWGASAIPAHWRDRITLGDRIVALARGLYVAGGGALDPAGADAARWPHDRFIHGWWVEPGRLLAGEYPGHPDAGRARQKVDLLVDAGIRSFVDLTTPDDGLQPYEPLVQAVAADRRLDLRHVPFPIPDMSVVGDADYDTVLSLIDDGIQRGGVYVHCWGGVGRTGTVVGCRLADQRHTYDEVVDRLTTLRVGTAKASRSSPETAAQRAVVRRRTERGAPTS